MQCGLAHTCIEGDCVHKDLFPMGFMDIIMTVTSLCISAVLASIRVMDGCIYVPVLALMANFSPHIAVPLASSVVFGNGLGMLLTVLVKPHPVVPRPLIDYNLAMLMQPIMLGGTTIGVLLNFIFPSWLITLFLVAFLCFATIRSFRRGLRAWRHESVPKDATSVGASTENGEEPPPPTSEPPSEPATADTPAPTPAPPLLTSDASDPTATPRLSSFDTHLDCPLLPEGNERAVRDLLRREAKYPLLKFLVMVGFFALIILFCILHGAGHTRPSPVGIKPCTAGFWVLWLGWFVICFGFAAVVWLVWHRLIQRHKIQLQFRFDRLGEVRWNYKNATIYAIVALAAGFGSGHLAIGAGFLAVPVLVAMGMNRKAAEATCMICVPFLAGSTTAQFLITENMPLSYSLWMMLIGVVASLSGVFGLGYLIRRLRKSFVFIFILTLLNIVSAIMVSVILFYDIAVMIEAKRGSGFRPLCNH